MDQDTCYLPNSRICFRFGTRLAFVGAGESMEGIGFAPDISEEAVPARFYKKDPYAVAQHKDLF